jgi:hypothetical protein
MVKLWVMAEPEAELEAILAEARASVAAGREPDVSGLERRVTVAAGPDVEAGAQAREQLVRIAAVWRARSRVAQEREPVEPPKPRSVPLREAFRARPTISGTLEVRRAANRAGFWIEWRPDPAVTEWEVRFSERPDLRSEYAERESRTLAADETALELPLGENPFQVAIVGRGRTGRAQRRALISGLTRESWRERWQRRAGS